MSLAVIFTRAQLGVSAPEVTVEVHLSNGLPAFTIVGLPETAVKESKDRVRSALINSHFEFPQKRITVNLAPADLPKEGGRFDLPIALGILAASQQLPNETLGDFEFIGELALSGELRRVRGGIPTAIECAKKQRKLILPFANSAEASLCQTTKQYLAKNLLSVCAHIHGRETLPEPKAEKLRAPTYAKDLSDVKGQTQARRALEIAAAGGHNLLFFGPPGTGKSMLASRLPSILPQLHDEEALELAAVRSVASENINDDWINRPFRSPHHTSSAVALVGGGSHPKPGEISLAHKGVLFLDELPEFSRHVLEVLREPIESGSIHLSRANSRVTYPAEFQLIAAMNPCPCGYHGDASGKCVCSPTNIERYRNKISGPLLDRIDLQVRVNTIPIKELQNTSEAENSDSVRSRVSTSRKHQIERQKKPNASLEGKQLNHFCRLGNKERQLLENAMEKLRLSARAYDRILRVARTIADLSKEENISTKHISEALSYRNLDRARFQ